MAFDELMGLTNRLLANALALAAVAAHCASRSSANRLTRGARSLLEGVGFTDVREAERTWNPPLRFVVGTRT